MWSPVTHIPPPLSAAFISPPPKWLDSDDDFEHEPALISDDALSSSCSRAPSLAPLDSEDPHIDIVSSPVQDTFFRAYPSSRTAPLSRYNKRHSSSHAKPSTTREDVAAALLALRAQPRLGSSRPAPPNVWTAQPAAETQPHPPASTRRSRVISPSLRNLVLPRTPSPPPRAPLPMTHSPPIINLEQKPTTSAHTTPPPRRTPVSSPLPPSSPFAEDDDYERSAPTRFHSTASPKLEHLEVHIPPDNAETDVCASLSRDGELQEDTNDSNSITHGLIPATSSLATSLVPEATPDESSLVRERHHSAPLLPLASDTCAPLPSPPDRPADSCSVPVLDPTSVASAPQTPSGQSQHGPYPRVSVSLLASAPPMDSSSSHTPDTTDASSESELAVPPSHHSSRHPSPPMMMTADSDPCQDLDLVIEQQQQRHQLSPSPQRSQPTSSPLSSPPSSPSPEQRRIHRSSSSSPSPPPSLAAGTKRATPSDESDDREVDTTEPEPTSAPARARSKRRRRDANADDDKPWRDRKKHTTTVPTHDSPSASPAPSTTASSSHSSSSDAPELPSPCPSPCPHPSILGLLLETLALSRASSLTQNALIRTNPALAPSSSSSSSSDEPAMLATTLEWAVRARVLGCVRSSGEKLPPSYFYDPTEDPDRERGELLKCLMPRAGKRRETKKYKQYYWAPVVVGRGRARTWDVDWEE